MNVLHNTADKMNTHSLSLHFMFLLHCNEQWWSCAIQETLVIMLRALLWEYQSNVISYNSFKCCKQTSHPTNQPTSKSVNQSISQPVSRTNQCMTNWMFLWAHYPFNSFENNQGSSTLFSSYSSVSFSLSLSLRLCLRQSTITDLIPFVIQA